MKKIIYSFLLGIALISHSLYAGMEQTEQCLQEINRLERKIKDLENKKTHLQELIKDKGRWASFPLIPKFMLTWKLKNHEQKIQNLQDQDIDAQIIDERRKLTSQENRLNPPASIIIRQIKVEASGEWDKFPVVSPPDITVLLDNEQFGPMIDTERYTFSLSENVTRKQWLEIRDKDPIGHDSMVVVELEKFSNCRGVEGDSFTKVMRGRVDRDEKRITKYEITYEVNF